MIAVNLDTVAPGSAHVSDQEPLVRSGFKSEIKYRGFVTWVDFCSQCVRVGNKVDYYTGLPEVRFVESTATP